MNTTKKHESTTERGVFFWAEPNQIRGGANGRPGSVESWCLLSQAPGGQATEAFDDWFANEKDADEIAQQLARGEL